MKNQATDELVSLFENTIGTFSKERPILYFKDTIITTGSLIEQTDAMMRYLKAHGVTAGTAVGYALPNSPEVFYLFFALMRIGACSFPVFPMVPDVAKVAIFSRSHVPIVIVSSQHRAALQKVKTESNADFSIVTIDANGGVDSLFVNGALDIPSTGSEPAEICNGGEPFMMASSSGTTGMPKPIVLSRSNAVSALTIASAMVDRYEHEGQPSNIVAFPLSTSGMLVCSGILMAGVPLILTDTINPVSFMDLIIKHKPGMISAPPAYFESLLHIPVPINIDMGFVTTIMTGMDFFSPSLMSRLKKKFPGIASVAIGYGLMETSTIVMLCKRTPGPSSDQSPDAYTLVNDDNVIDVRDSQGNSVPIGEEGELYIKGKSVITYYPGDNNETQNSFRNGWFRTGDIVKKNGLQSIILLGRNKYMIKRGGKTVSPVVVQEHITTHHSVMHAVVVGVPHQLYGEMVWAFVVAKPCTELSTRELMKHCRQTLVNYMVPDQVTFLPEIPKKPGVGKIDIDQLRHLAIKELEEMGGNQNG
jgi:acyl-coenzyme A synthetase/AMP-(fatty) acid ligase